MHVANHGQEALDFLRDSDVWKGNAGGKCLDDVLMDLEMPIMDEPFRVPDLPKMEKLRAPEQSRRPSVRRLEE